MKLNNCFWHVFGALGGSIVAMFEYLFLSIYAPEISFVLGVIQQIFAFVGLPNEVFGSILLSVLLLLVISGLGAGLILYALIAVNDDDCTELRKPQHVG